MAQLCGLVLLAVILQLCNFVSGQVVTTPPPSTEVFPQWAIILMGVLGGLLLIGLIIVTVFGANGFKACKRQDDNRKVAPIGPVAEPRPLLFQREAPKQLEAITAEEEYRRNLPWLWSDREMSYPPIPVNVALPVDMPPPPPPLPPPSFFNPTEPDVGPFHFQPLNEEIPEPELIGPYPFQADQDMLLNPDMPWGWEPPMDQNGPMFGAFMDPGPGYM